MTLMALVNFGRSGLTAYKLFLKLCIKSYMTGLGPDYLTNPHRAIAYSQYRR